MVKTADLRVFSGAQTPIAWGVHFSGSGKYRGFVFFRDKLAGISPEIEKRLGTPSNQDKQKDKPSYYPPYTKQHSKQEDQ
ncbi:uncharacterized protein G2W53_009520 [Senna tora]|uniref:Uncharacterized protein n=1 Tax=Senna tora TaxID=362788 RepID=A0A835CA89_9FABA|nr:uncharacterized protein G2W53_009520 [Senna tora]